ncbi:MAG: M23 family metallopeptidase [Kineothrix sp.]|nr:M23 family metallopeptidase [Kineothrix sp.]
MRRRNRGGANKEKVIMVLSSVFVLAALTATGLFFRGKSEEKNDGYVVDFSAIENESDTLVKNESTEIQGVMDEAADAQGVSKEAVTADDLDYDPYFQETNSVNVENEENTNEENEEEGKDQKVEEKSGEKDKKKNENGEEGMIDEAADSATLEEVARMEEMEDTMAIATSTSIQPALTFGDKDTLAWPIVGNVLINYSMDKTIYFPTLEQYKYNPAIIISAVEGETITAAANGKVNSIYSDPELGNVVVMELGNGYELTYGQLKDITVSEGGFVNKGDIIGSVAAPTKYYSVEGCNVYFKLTKDGAPVNPMTKLTAN